MSCQTLTSRYLKHHDGVSRQTQDLRNLNNWNDLFWQIQALRRLMHNNYVFLLIMILRYLKTVTAFSDSELAKFENPWRRYLAPILRNLNWQMQALRRLIHNNYASWLTMTGWNLKNHNGVFWFQTKWRRVLAPISRNLKNQNGVVWEGYLPMPKHEHDFLLFGFIYPSLTPRDVLP